MHILRQEAGAAAPSSAFSTGRGSQTTLPAQLRGCFPVSCLSRHRQRWMNGFVSSLLIDDRVKWSLGLEFSPTLECHSKQDLVRLSAAFLSLSLCYRDRDGHSGGHSWTGMDSVSKFWGESLMLSVIKRNFKMCCVGAFSLGGSLKCSMKDGACIMSQRDK